jgi:hypothetical protein
VPKGLYRAAGASGSAAGARCASTSSERLADLIRPGHRVPARAPPASRPRGGGGRGRLRGHRSDDVAGGLLRRGFRLHPEVPGLPGGEPPGPRHHGADPARGGDAARRPGRSCARGRPRAGRDRGGRRRPRRGATSWPPSPTRSPSRRRAARKGMLPPRRCRRSPPTPSFRCRPIRRRPRRPRPTRRPMLPPTSPSRRNPPPTPRPSSRPRPRPRPPRPSTRRA